MAYPKQVEIELPLLRVLAELGGEARPRDVYPRVAAHFPQLTPEEQEERLPDYPSTRKWSNLVQWVRQRLVDQRQIDGSKRGVWRLTPAGKARAESGDAAPIPDAATAVAAVSPQQTLSLRDLVNANQEEIRARLIAELKDLSPRAFEHFCREFLAHLGYRNVEVTRKSQDGGIDGFGDFRFGAISIRSAFQAKRWSETVVGRPEIDRFRGAIQGEFDHGVYLSTSRFSKDAKQASYKHGAITILLLDGPAIADLLLERGLGVRRLPVFIYDIDDDFFDLEEE